MIRIVLLILLFVVLLSGLGIEIERKWKFESQGFSAPLGFVAFLTILQFCYYPIQLMNASFHWIVFVTVVLGFISIVITIKNWKQVCKNLVRRESILLLLCILMFCFVFYYCFIDIEFSDSPMYLNYIAQNINNPSINLFHLYTGAVGSEWDALYLFQGYYHFGSFLCWVINLPLTLFGRGVYIENIVISTWGLGILYSSLSSMFFINIWRYFKYKNKWMGYILLLFTLLFSNFYYWRVAFAFYGNTYRTLLATMLMFMIYRWLKEDNNQMKWNIPLIIGAGLACSSSFLFVSVIIVYCLAAYLFKIKKVNAFNDLATFVFPIALYASIMISRSSILVGSLLGMIFAYYYIGRYFAEKNVKKSSFYWILKLQNACESFLYQRGKLIFYIIIPIVFALLSLLINVFNTDYLINYAYFFQNHQKYDMVKDYTFVYAGAMDNVLNLIRWMGVFLIIKKSNTVESGFIKSCMILMVVFFMNPLCTTGIAYTIASNVFYRSVEVIFNPFTEFLILLAILDAFEWKKCIQWFLGVILLGVICWGHGLSWANSEEGLYTFHVNGGKTVDPITKIERGELQAIKVLQEELKNIDLEGQPVIISQANGLRTFIPNAVQPVTTRDYYYPHTRLDWNLYEIVRKHYPWQEVVSTQYEDACMYFKRYEVDYAIIKYWENNEFDQAIDACSTTLFEGAEFKVKKIVKK